MTLNIKKLLIAAIGAACVGLAGCQTAPSNWRDDVRSSIDASLERAKTSDAKVAVPGAVSDALLPPLEVTVPNGTVKPLESRFDISVSGAPARQVFMSLVEGTPYDVVVQPGVTGTITLTLKDVTVPEAFATLRDAYGYEYRREGNRFVVLAEQLQTRLFNVNYLNLVRKGKSDTRVSGGGIGQRSSGAGSTSTTSADTQSGFSSVELETASESDFWKDLQATLSSLVAGEGRRVIVNPQTGVVAVRAMPDELRLVEEYLGTTHDAVNRQVVLETNIVEVELNDRFQTGINWAKVKGDYTVGQVGGGTQNLQTTGQTPVGGLSGSLLPGTVGVNGVFGANDLPAVGTLTDTFGGVFTIATVGNDFTALVELLKAQGEVQVLSTPRVSAVNNQKAVIKVGADEFFVTGISSTTTNTTTGQSLPTVELSSFFSGIVLDVTPQIDESDNIVLHIHPSVSAVSEKVKTFTAQGFAFSLPLAFSTIQESDNVVRAQSGQVIVIGGLMKEGSTDENAAVPLLGDIPILGNLFKHKRVTRIKKELVILLKPTVIKLNDDWNKAVGDSQERIKKIRIGS